MLQIGKNKIFLFLGLISLASMGCSDVEKLQKAQSFANMANSFQEKSGEISSDMYFSCLRRTQYFHIESPASQDSREDALQICETSYKPAMEAAIASSAVISEYITAIGRVGGFNLDSTEDLNRIKAVIDAHQGKEFKIDENALEAGFGIIGFLLDVGVRRIQVESLSEPIICSNDDIQIYSTGLARAFQEGYVNGVLVEEQSAVEDYYSVRALLLQESDNTDPMDFRILDAELAEATGEIANRKISGESYIEMIESIARQHNHLAGTFIAETTTPDCSAYANLVREESTELSHNKELFNVLEKTNEEINALLEKYEDSWPD